MAFEQNKTKSKNQFAARIISNKTQDMAGWFHMTDNMARKVFGVSNVSEVTYAAAAEKLPQILDNERTSVAVSDMTADLIAIDVKDF